jgi:stage II sporulation SpoE-like protein
MTTTAGTPAKRLRELAAGAALSTLVGLAFVFLMFIGRREMWSWRLAVYGALGGFTIHVFCHLLDDTLGDRVRRLGVMPDKLVGVPLYFVGGCLGVVTVTGLLRALDWLPFKMSGSDVRLSLLISGGVAIAVGLLFYSFGAMQARLRESVERIKEQEYAEKELQLARQIQLRLLPPEDIEGDGWRIAASNLAAQFVAGDFYDVFRLADGALGIAIGDVSGKGIGASLIMASVKAAMSLIAENRDAAATLAELNRRLSRDLGPREFVALAYVRYEPASGALEIANAGLPDPYLLRGAAVTALRVPGPRLPLGVRAEVDYESLRASLAPGERVLLLTDGLPEAPTPSGEPLGYEALARLIAGNATPRGAVDALFDAVRRATKPELEDDWTAVVIERS